MFFLLIISSQILFAQKKEFQGKLVYKITVRDTSLRNLIPDNQVSVYTNDTISRTENYTATLGKQILIRQMQMDKGYILIETPIGNYAIKQMPVPDSLKASKSYTFKKKCFKKKVLGMKANRYLVNHSAFNDEIEFLYLKKYSNKYLNNFPEIPGLLVKYSIATPDAVLDYELIEFKPYSPDRDLFGIPSDFQKVTMDEFIDIVTGVQQQPEVENPKNN